jgi:16S rRNA processing protein RimM
VPDSTEQVTIGKVIKPFGVRGELRVESLSDIPGRFEALDRVTLVSPTGERVVQDVVSAKKQHGPYYLMRFKGYDTPETAGQFRGWVLSTDRRPASGLPDGEYLQCDLIGLTVLDDSGELVGRLDELIETPSNAVFVVHNGTKETLIPAIKRAVVSVDLKARVMTVNKLHLVSE